MEINAEGGLQPRGFDGWDVWSPNHTPYDNRGRSNSNPRMIKHPDDRHGGMTTVVFLDGHTETRKLGDNESDRGVPFRLFNPLDMTARR